MKEVTYLSHQITAIASEYGCGWHMRDTEIVFIYYRGLITTEVKYRIDRVEKLDKEYILLAYYTISLPPGVDSLEEVLIGLCFKGVTDHG